VRVVNLDPGQDRSEEEEQRRPFDVDVRDLISVADVLEELSFGPNGALVFCMEHLVDNFDWLREQVEAAGGSEDEYFIFDCPGQIELYTHIPVLTSVVEQLQSWNFHVCVVHVLDALFIDDTSKYISGALLALTSMLQLKAPTINVVTKCDLKKDTIGGGRKRRPLARPKVVSLNAQRSNDFNYVASVGEEFEAVENVEDDSDKISESEFLNVDDLEYFNPGTDLLRFSLDDEAFTPQLRKLNSAICDVLDSYNLVNFLPLDITSEESLEHILIQIDTAVQYGEDLEPRDPGDFEEEVEGGD